MQMIQHTLPQDGRSNSPRKTYRRIKPKSIPCPRCGFKRLIDVGVNTTSETLLPGDPEYAEADFYQKCKGCSTEVGIKKV